MDYKGINQYMDRLIEEGSPQNPVWNIEFIRQKKKPSFNYIDGCMMISLINLYKKTGEEKYFDFVKNYIDFFLTDDGDILYYDKEEYNLDNVNEGRVFFDLYEKTGDEKYKKAAYKLFNQLIDQPRTKEGNFWHKKIYPNQVWLDGLFMAQVFSYRFQANFGKGDYSDVINQFRTVERVMKDSSTGLYYHGYDSSKKMFWCDERGLSKNFWLRATGWYLAALSDVTSYMEDGAVKTEFSAYLKNAVDSVLNFMDQDSGMFYQVINMVDRPGNYLETSGSALIAYAILKGANSGVLDKSYLAVGKKIFDGIVNKYFKENNGVIELNGICLVAGLGPESNLRRDGSFEYYISEPIVSTDAKGVAPFILAYVELLSADL